MQERIGVVFGGKSGEHEVSIVSARNIMKALDPQLFQVVPIGIDKQGIWRVDGESAPLLIEKNGAYVINSQAPAINLHRIGDTIQMVNRDTAEKRGTIDVFFPIVHGNYGEDGCLQGFFRLLEAPFVGAGVLGSAVGMDKEFMKRLLREAGLPICRFVTVQHYEAAEISFAVLAQQLGTPFFVKPCNLGSSVGIHRVDNPDDFERAMTDAFQYDTKLIIEEYVQGRELECSVLGNDQPRASVPGEVCLKCDFYSYHAKYESEEEAVLKIPAELDEDTVARIQKISIKAFQALECAGMARVDLFLTESGDILLNEINTLPGFTNISMYPKLWDSSGLGYGELLTELIRLAKEKHAQLAGLKRSYI